MLSAARDRLCLALAFAGTLILLVWTISVTGTTGWGEWVNWPLLLCGVGLLALRTAVARLPR